MRLVRFGFDLAAILLFLAIVGLAWRNRGATLDLDLVFWKLEHAPAMPTLIAILIGGTLVAALFAIPEWLRLRMKLRDRADEKL